MILKHLRPDKKDKDFYSKLKFNSFFSWVKTQFALRAYLESAKGKAFPTITIKFSYQIAENEEKTIAPSDFPQPSNKGEFSVAYQEPFDDNGKLGWRKVETLRRLAGVYLAFLLMKLIFMARIYAAKIFLSKKLKILFLKRVMDI